MWYLLATPPPVIAQTVPHVRIRALLPQPSTGMPEWVLLERADGNTATFSATLGDTHGSTKAFTWIWEESRFWYQLTATQSGIALNNDQDGVTLEVNGTQVDSTATYSTSERDMVWTRLASEWHWLPLAEFEERWETSNWELEPSPIPTPAPFTSPAASATPTAAKASPTTMPTTSRSASQAEHDRPPPTPYPGKPFQLQAVAREESATPAADRRLLSFVEPDYAAEEARYQEWLQWWRRALGLFLGSAACWWSVIVLELLKRLKQRTARRWGWSLLS